MFSCTKQKNITYNSNVTCSFENFDKNKNYIYKYEYNFVDSTNSIKKIDSVYLNLLNKGLLIFNGDPNAIASNAAEGAYNVKCNDNWGNYR